MDIDDSGSTTHRRRDEWHPERTTGGPANLSRCRDRRLNQYSADSSMTSSHRQQSCCHSAVATGICEPPKVGHPTGVNRTSAVRTPAVCSSKKGSHETSRLPLQVSKCGTINRLRLRPHLPVRRLQSPVAEHRQPCPQSPSDESLGYDAEVSSVPCFQSVGYARESP